MRSIRGAVLLGLALLPMPVPAMPGVDIAAGPVNSANIQSNVLLSLSIDLSSVGIAYRDHLGSYNRGEEYLGYFNPSQCYEYSEGSRNTRDGYFSIKKGADAAHECGGDTFSGNFLNWASLSTLDVLRYALTGGDRVIDTVTQTILQRAVLPDEFYAHAAYFPRRSITRSTAASAPGQVTPFDVDTLYIVSCRNRILFSESASSGNDCDTPAYGDTGTLLNTDKKLGEYLVRVSVCDAVDARTRPNYCQLYSDHYKPVGEIQRHSKKMRFGAMGYLLDDAPERYGGVLRVPMKYVGHTKASGAEVVETVNEHREWDANTGVLYSDPQDRNNDLPAHQKSGLLNYLNQFGRDGKYKTNDPLSELYYEGLRYVQGKQPTANATGGINSQMKGGFPVVERWVDPITGSCQKTSVIAIADADTRWDRYLPGNHRTIYNGSKTAHDGTRAIERAVVGITPGLNAMTKTAKVSEMESDRAGLYTNPASRASMTDLQNRDTGDLGRGTYYMAGLAYWANTNDVRLDKPLRVKTFAIDLDAGGNGSIDRSTRSVHPRESQLYMAAKYGGFDDRNEDGNPYITVGKDGKTEVGSNVEWEGNDQGLPRNYFLAGSPQDLVRAVHTVFSAVAQRQTQGDDVLPGFALSSTKSSSEGTFVYQAGFSPARWSGSLTKRALTFDEEGIAKIAPVAEWDAGEILSGNEKNAPGPAPDARRIYTARRSAGRQLNTVPFQWRELSGEQQALLNISPVTQTMDGLGEKRVQYLRGVRELELGTQYGKFRQRDSVLGDIVHSKPKYAGAPQGVARDLPYQQFVAEHRRRKKAVYVGANDGMLHAFDAENGTELFAYVPDVLFRHLSQLTAPEYIHRSYLNGELGLGDALVSGKWRTVLAAGMGGGAQGVVVLDVTEPQHFGDGGGGVLFEFTDRDDGDIGNLTGAPQIAKVKIKTANGRSEYGHFIVVPSGLNNTKEDGDGRFSVSGQGALFLLSLDKAPEVPWKLGVNYYKIRFPLSDASLPNGVIAPALVLGRDDALRYAYAGDLQGNLWRLDFSANAPWLKALGAMPNRPLFTAKDVKGRRQPITVQPRVVFAPGGYLVLFGTGKFLEDSDAAVASFTTQSFYAIHDAGDESSPTTMRHELARRRLAASDRSDGIAVDVAADEFAAAGVSAAKGWYFDFMAAENTGERNVTNSEVGYGRVFFNTLIPARDACGTATSRSYVFDVSNGLPPSGAPTGFLSDIGVLGMPQLFDTSIEIGVIGPMGKKQAKRKYSIINPGGKGDIGLVKPISGNTGSAILSAGRLSWREVINWQELRDAINKK